MKGIHFRFWKIAAIAASPPDKVWQTRRLMQNQPTEMDKCYETAFMKDFGARVPRYQPGEVVYIKEAYMLNKEYDHLKPSEIPEVGRKVAIWYYADGNHYADKVSAGAGKLRSPLFMPAWAARYFVKILTAEPWKYTFVKVDEPAE